MNENFDWAKNLNKLIDNINNSHHRITGFTPNEIQTAFKNSDKVVLDEVFDTELKKKKPNISREVYEVGDSVRIHKPSDKTRQVWSKKYMKLRKSLSLKILIVYMNIN